MIRTAPSVAENMIRVSGYDCARSWPVSKRPLTVLKNRKNKKCLKTVDTFRCLAR